MQKLIKEKLLRISDLPKAQGTFWKKGRKKLEARKECCKLLSSGYEMAFVLMKHSSSGYLHKIKPVNIPHA